MINNFLEKTNNKDNYEPLNWSQISFLKDEISNDIYSNVCILLSEDSHIRIVICKLFSFSPLQYVISKNQQWSKAETDSFDELLKLEHIDYDSHKFREVYKQYSKLYPEWNLKFNSEMPLRMLDHIQNCLNPSGAKEILYKAGLDEFAANFSTIEECNIIGETPEEILGLNLQTLNAINCTHGSKLISTEEKRQKLALLQNKYSYLFSMPWTPFMCQYMENLILQAKSPKNVIRYFVKKFWGKSLQNISHDTMHTAACQMYNEMLGELGEKMISEISPKQIQHYHKFLVEEKDYWNQEIQLANEERNNSYELTDVNYTVTYPETIKEFVAESISQRTCLLSYLDDFVCFDTDVLFLRKTEHKRQSYVTLEIHNGKLINAFAKDEAKPDERVLKWLKIYAKYIGIEYAIDETQYE